MKVSAVIPTRGDVDLVPIIKHLNTYPEIQDISTVESDSVFGRFLGVAQKAKHDVIYTQDDDVITDLRPILDAYEPGIIVNAMSPEHQQHYLGTQTLIGFCAIFDKKLIDVLLGWECDPLFLRTCDRVFTALNKHKVVYPKITHMPYATADNRMYRQPQHFGDRVAITQRIFEKTGIRDAN